jgi:pimeloyl-ACP methyl ester carboxylesterase
MRKKVLLFIVLLSVLSAQGFIVAWQPAETNIIILNRNDQVTTRITDGDSIRVQIRLSQQVSSNETVTFTLSDALLPAGSCIITMGNDSCTTDSFSSLGWYWDPDGTAQGTRIVQAKNNAGIVIGQSAQITASPRPVVLVHGFISNWQTWNNYLAPEGYLSSLGLKGYAVGDGQVPGVLNTGVITNPVGRTNSIAGNAEILGQYISNVKAQTGAEMVDLVVHSMGGMISRYYIDRVMQERDVAQLIMLGSPMGGSDCSVLPAALGFFLPASIEIRESYMRGVFNQQITHRKGIEFYDLGGTAINESFKSPCTGIPNDTVVSFDSINAILLQSSQLEVIHSDLTFSDQAFVDFVKPLLQKTAGSFVSQPDPAPVAPPDSPLDFTRVYTGHVDAGGSTDITINIEPGVAVASFALYDASRSVVTIVRGASGNVIELNPETNGFIQVDDPSSLLYLGYGFPNPRPGVWSITVQATGSTPASGTDFAISVYFIGGAKLETSSGTLVPQLRDDVELTANVLLNGEALEISSAQAVIKKPNGEVETIDFPAGRNVSVVWTPDEAGTHAVDIVVTALAPDGSSIERTDFLAIEVQPGLGQAQITLNLILVIAGVVLVLGVILFFVIRGLIRLTRRTNS